MLPQNHASFRPMSRGVIGISWLLFLWSPNIYDLFFAIHTHRSIETAAKVNRDMHTHLHLFVILSWLGREQDDNFIKFHNQGDECHVYAMFWIPLCKNMW